VTTWNSADKGSDVTLSGGDLVATVATNSRMAVRSTTSKNVNGLYYFEVLVGSNQIGIGLANASAPVSNAGNSFWESAHGIGLYMSGANSVIVYSGGAVQSGLASFTSGDVIGVAYNRTAGTVQFYKNNVALGSADANVASITGAIFAAVGGHNSAASQIGTARFATADLTYSPPGGFSAWDSLVSHTHAMTGGIGVGGEATIAVYPPPAHPITGGIKIGGSATITFQIAYVHQMTGGIGVGGTSPMEFTTPTVHTWEPSGGVVLGGEAKVTDNIPHLPSGGLVLGGAAPVLESIAHLPSGGIVLAGGAPNASVMVFPPSGGIVVAGAAPISATTYHLPSGGVVIAGAAAVSDYRAWHQPEGGIVLGGTALAYVVPSGTILTTENPYNDEFPGWAINLETGAPSRYRRLPANSFCVFGGKAYVANAGGIYELGGEDDAGQPIRAFICLPTTDYGSEMNKRIPDVFIGLKAKGRMRLEVRTNTGEAAYYDVTDIKGDLLARRVVLGQGLEGRYWTLGLANTEGCAFSFQSMSYTPTLLKRHGR
jgi:hypothetical protein